jgi:hypothetical protein
MPSTIREVFAGAGLEPEGCVRWNQRVACRDTGVYAVALTDNLKSLAEALPTAPLRRAGFIELLGVREELRLDSERPSAAALQRRIAAFWLPDEVVLYIGLSSRPLVTRVREYYRTPLGAAKPHAGGWWLKTLSILNNLWVHYAPTPDCDSAEDRMLRTFARAVSLSSREALHDSVRVMPFANLKDADDLIKDHGIERATGPMPSASAGASGPRNSPSRPNDAAVSKSPSAPAPAGTEVSRHYRTLPVTASDRGAGRVRIGRGATKRLFPPQPETVDVELRGHRKTCSWNPRFGPPERSGVLGLGRAVLAELVQDDEELRVACEDDIFRLS